MKTITASNDGEFAMWREIGADDFTRTPAKMLGARIVRLSANAKAPGAGVEEKGLLTGFLEALARLGNSEMRALGLRVTNAATIAPRSQQDVAIVLQPDRKICVLKR